LAKQEFNLKRKGAFWAVSAECEKNMPENTFPSGFDIDTGYDLIAGLTTLFREVCIMPKEGLTEIVCIIDKSGSMEAVKEDAIGGFNSFLKEQQEIPGEALVTIVLFDTAYMVVADGVPIDKVPPLDERTYRPGGMTALLDAIGLTLDKVQKRIEETPVSVKPEKVIVAILTDGLENSSVEYSGKQILAKVQHKQQVDCWEFVYLGANQDAIKEGTSLGIKVDNAMNFASTGDGVRDSYKYMSNAVRSYREKGFVDKEWKNKGIKH